MVSLWLTLPCSYPIGGDTMSVTSGVVSRIEVTSYVHGASELLGIQIDAAINSGNSGGPALNDDDECVGIAFQSLKHEDAENIGWVAFGVFSGLCAIDTHQMQLAKHGDAERMSGGWRSGSLGHMHHYESYRLQM